VCEADGIVVISVPPSPNAHKKEHPTRGGVKVPLNVTIATPGLVQPLTVAVSPVTVGHPPQGGIVTVTASSTKQEPPLEDGHVATTLAVKEPAKG
jgi:hypothetical protein